MWNMLVVEDESIVRMGLRHIINWEEHGVIWKEEAASGEEALTILDQADIHIVITDIHMPGMDGIELAKQVKARNPNIYIIFLSSYDNFEYVRGAIRLGAGDYLHKPTMDEEELVRSLQKATQGLNMMSNTTSSSMTEEERNKLLLSCLDRFTFPGNSALFETVKECFNPDCQLVVFRKRDNAVSEEEESAKLRFLSIQYLITEFVSRDWGGLVFHRNYREIIWLSPLKSKSGESSREACIDNLRQKALELLNVRLIFAVSSACFHASELPNAYLDALLRLPVHDLGDNLIVRKAKAYLDEHLLEDITLTKVSEAIHVSPGYLSRIFLKQIGENFTDYIIRNKIRYAQKLLRETNRKVYEIAADIGYANPHYFSKLFKERVGITPLEYRNQ